MWTSLSNYVYLLFGLINLINAGTIPSYIKICHQSDPALSDCIKHSIEVIRPQLKQGIPEIGVPPLEPLKVDDIFMNLGNERFRISLNLTNVMAEGASNFELQKLKLNVAEHYYKMEVFFPQILIKGNYSVDTKILNLPIKSKGGFIANAKDIFGTGILKGEILRDKIEHLHFTDLPISLKIGDYNLKLDNIVEGDDTLNEAINELANQNKPELIRISTPFIEARVSDILLTAANKITENLVYDEAFPK